MFKKGKIVLVPFPFTDLSSEKLRPALIVSDENVMKKDVIVAFISSKMDKLGKCDLGLKKQNDNGLKVDSVVRLNKLATLSKSIILGSLGEISASDLEAVDQRVKMALGLK